MSPRGSSAAAGLGLRGRFLLLLLLVLLPLGAVGVAGLRAALRSGEALLRERLEEALLEAVQAVGTTWVNHRSELLYLAEHPAMVAALAGERPLEAANHPATADLGRLWARLADVAESVTLRGTEGDVLGGLEREPHPSGSVPGARSTTLPVTLLVHDPATGAPVGSLDVRLHLTALLPAGLWWAGVGGSVLAIFDGHGSPLLPLAIGPELFAQERFTWDGSEWLTVRHELYEPRMTFAVAAPVEPFARPFAHATRQGTLALLMAIAVGFVLASLLTRRMTRPLARLARAADDVARGRLDPRVQEEGPHEIRRVARAFNIMTEGLRRTLRKLSQQEAVAAVGEFAATLAHEVRNPLTSIRLDLERARDRVDENLAAALLDRAIGEIERLDATVNGSLRIARSGRIRLEPLDLRQPLDAAMHAARPEYDLRGASLEGVDGGERGITILGNAGALEQLFLNLLRNSAEALRPGGRTVVRLRTRGDNACVVVEDDGTGIPPDDVDRVVEPFYSTRDGGTGLGLPIVQRIAHAHGGDLRIESTPGVGTTVTVMLPLDIVSSSGRADVRATAPAVSAG